MKALALVDKGIRPLGPGQGAHIRLRTLCTLVRTQTVTKTKARTLVTVTNFDPSNTTGREKIPCCNISKGREHIMKPFFRERKRPAQSNPSQTRSPAFLYKRGKASLDLALESSIAQPQDCCL